LTGAAYITSIYVCQSHTRECLANIQFLNPEKRGLSFEYIFSVQMIPRSLTRREFEYRVLKVGVWSGVSVLGFVPSLPKQTSIALTLGGNVVIL
jgi:hypothetical protein